VSDQERPLDPLFDPRTVAVAGASNDESKKGHLVLRNLLDTFPGTVYPVHPTESTIVGLAAHRSIAEVPGTIDLLIPLIPAAGLLPLVEACPPGKVKILLAIPSGFGEVSRDGEDLEARLVNAARVRGMRVVGPNTLGATNWNRSLNASLAPPLPAGRGVLSVVTQSGGFGMAVYMYAVEHGLEVAKFCDLGNTADVSIAEVLAHYKHDSDTGIVGAFLESHPEPVASSLADVAHTKPVIVTSLGHSPAGRRATLAHLGPTPGSYPVSPPPVANVVIAETGLEILEIAKALTWQPLPRGNRVAILTGSGGIGIELVDLCIGSGLEVPELSDELQERLRPHLPSFAGLRNPVDLTPAWPDYPVMYPPLMKELLDSTEIDSLIVTVIDMATALPALMEAVVSSVQEHRTESAAPKPVLVYWVAPPGRRRHRQMLQEAGVPCYSSTATIARVASALTRLSPPTEPIS